jgi:hypothetical protein
LVIAEDESGTIVPRDDVGLLKVLSYQTLYPDLPDTDLSSRVRGTRERPCCRTI